MKSKFAAAARMEAAIQAEEAVGKSKAHDLIQTIIRASELLGSEKDLSPANRRVTEIVGRLSAMLRIDYLPEEVEAVLHHECLLSNANSLREKLGEAEFLAELADAKRMVARGIAGLESLVRLPYWDIYVALVSAEIAELRSIEGRAGLQDGSPIVFVGGGPMPLSPILAQLLSGHEVVCLDMNPAACEASFRLLQKAGLETKIKVVTEDGASFDYSSCRCVFVASLVQNKLEVLQRIAHTAFNPLVAVRTASGMKRIMYEGVDENELARLGWRIQGRTRPDAGLVINSTIFLALSEK